MGGGGGGGRVERQSSQRAVGRQDVEAEVEEVGLVVPRMDLEVGTS